MKIENINKAGLEHILYNFERFAKTYFWTSPKSASQRRIDEKRNSNRWEFIVDGLPVVCMISVTCSCSNYYATRSISHGEKNIPQMVRFLKKCIETMEESKCIGK